jgi:hypothetical protein
MPHCESEGQAFLLEIVSINRDPVVDKLAFFFIQECGFAREVGDENVSKDSRT